MAVIEATRPAFWVQPISTQHSTVSIQPLNNVRVLSRSFAAHNPAFVMRTEVADERQ